MTKVQANFIKAFAILFMLCLHLFNRDYYGLYQPILLIAGHPLAYYLGLLSDACVPMFCFVTGFGMFEQCQLGTLSFKLIFKRLKRVLVHFWVLLLFVLLFFLVFPNEFKPIEPIEWICNALLLSTSLNSTWWYLLTYCFLCIAALPIFKILNSKGYRIILLFSTISYVLFFYLRVYQEVLFENNILLNWMYRQLFLFMTSLYPFILGYMFSRFEVFIWLKANIGCLKFRCFHYSVLVLLIILHGLVPNFIVAPYTALVLMIGIVNFPFNAIFQKALLFIQSHSTNLWLLHFFWIQYPVKAFLFKCEFAPFIFLFLLLTTLVLSWLITLVQKRVAA